MLVALVVVVAVVLIGLIVALALPVLTHLPSIRNLPSAVPTRTAGSKPSATAKPTPSASSTASPDPKPTMPTSPLDVLKKNPIYGLKVPAKCAYQSTPGSQAAFRKQVRKLIDCENAAWRKALAPTAVKFGKPSVKFYSTSAMSPCGKLGTNYPASYCTADSTLYFSGASYLQGRYFRLSVAGFVMHEYAHHVQKLAGIFGATSAMKENASASSRRIELQAHCIAHYGLTVSGVGYSSVDDRQVRYQWDYTNDPKGHGSTTAERYWGLRGLDGKTIGACNTWSAKASRVK
jgi:predicted metalloprotease